jgi:hypothetical protein
MMFNWLGTVYRDRALIDFKDSQENAFRRLTRQAIRSGIDNRCHRDVIMTIVNHWFHHKSGPKDYIHPSRKLIARKARVSERTVTKVFSILREAGVLIPVSHMRGGRNIATQYRVDHEAIFRMCGLCWVKRFLRAVSEGCFTSRFIKKLERESTCKDNSYNLAKGKTNNHSTHEVSTAPKDTEVAKPKPKHKQSEVTYPQVSSSGWENPVDKPSDVPINHQTRDDQSVGMVKTTEPEQENRSSSWMSRAVDWLMEYEPVESDPNGTYNPVDPCLGWGYSGSYS